MVIIDEILVKSNDQRDKCYSFTMNYNQQLKNFTAVYSFSNYFERNTYTYLHLDGYSQNIGIILAFMQILIKEPGEKSLGRVTLYLFLFVHK